MLVVNQPAKLFSRFTRMPFALVIGLILAAQPYLSYSLGGAAGYHDKQRFAEALCLSLGALLTIKRVFSNDGQPLMPERSTLIGLTLFFLLGLVSSIFSFSPRHAFHEVASFFLLLTLSYMVADDIRRGNSRYLQILLLICGLGCAFYLYHLFINYAAFVLNGVQPRPYHIIHGFDNFRFLNHAQTISLPLLCLLVLQYKRDSRLYWFWFAIAALWWSIAYLTSARGLLVGVGAGGVAAALLLQKRAMNWCRILVLSAGAGIPAYIALFTLLPLAIGFEPFGLMASVVERTTIDPTSRRTELWQLAWTMIVDHPVLGAGPLHYAHEAVHLKNAAHPHNWVLQIAAEWGLPALFCISIVGIYAFTALLRAGRSVNPNDNTNQNTAAALLTVAISIAVDGLVSGLIVMPTSQTWIALFLGCAWGWSAGQAKSVRAAKQRCLGMPYRLAVAALMSGMLVLYWNGLFPELWDLETYEEAAMKEFKSVLYRPRIWLTGYF